MSDFKKGMKVVVGEDPHYYYGNAWCSTAKKIPNNAVKPGDVLEIEYVEYDGSLSLVGVDRYLDGSCVTPLDESAQEEGALKFDSDKPDPTLVPPKAIMAIAKAMGFGASKYGAGNFKQEPRLSRERLLGSVLRHILADLDGEQLDSESGLRHIYHAAAGLAMLLDDPREHDEVPRAGENQQEGDGG